MTAQSIMCYDLPLPLLVVKLFEHHHQYDIYIYGRDNGKNHGGGINSIFSIGRNTGGPSAYIGWLLILDFTHSLLPPISIVPIVQYLYNANLCFFSLPSLSLAYRCQCSPSSFFSFFLSADTLAAERQRCIVQGDLL